MKPALCVYCRKEPVFCTYAIGLVAIPVCARKRCTATFDEDSAAVHARVREGRVDTSTRETRDALRVALGRDLYTTADFAVVNLHTIVGYVMQVEDGQS